MAFVETQQPMGCSLFTQLSKNAGFSLVTVDYHIRCIGLKFVIDRKNTFT